MTVAAQQILQGVVKQIGALTWICSMAESVSLSDVPGFRPAMRWRYGSRRATPWWWLSPFPQRPECLHRLKNQPECRPPRLCATLNRRVFRAVTDNDRMAKVEK
jgi:hypothetical protein